MTHSKYISLYACEFSNYFYFSLLIYVETEWEWERKTMKSEPTDRKRERRGKRDFELTRKWKLNFI